MNEKYVIDKLKEIEETGAKPKAHNHTVSDILDMPTEFTPEEHSHAAGDITSGTLDAARIPNLTTAKISDFEERVEEITGGGASGGDIVSTSITNSGTITSTGLITANGGVKGNVTGSISGGTVAGSTGTFSEVVTAKNVNKFGLMPITLVLSTTERNNNLIDIPRPGLLEKSVNAGNYSSYSLFYSSRGIKTGYKSKVLFTAKEDSLLFAINDIKVSGNWSYKLVSGHADVSFKVTTSSGSVISGITDSGKSITFAQAKDILTDIITVEGTYSGANAYQNTSIYLHVTNNSNNVQYIYTTWSCLE